MKKSRDKEPHREGSSPRLGEPPPRPDQKSCRHETTGGRSRKQRRQPASPATRRAWSQGKRGTPALVARSGSLLGVHYFLLRSFRRSFASDGTPFLWQNVRVFAYAFQPGKGTDSTPAPQGFEGKPERDGSEQIHQVVLTKAQRREHGKDDKDVRGQTWSDSPPPHFSTHHEGPDHVHRRHSVAGRVRRAVKEKTRPASRHNPQESVSESAGDHDLDEEPRRAWSGS